MPAINAVSPQIAVARVTIGLCTLVLAVASGCNILLPFVLVGQHKEEVPAEFDKLEGKRAAIVVWAEPETLFDYPYVRLELALHVAEKIEASVPNVSLVDGRKVEDLIQRTLTSSVDPDEAGREFQSEMVVYIELLKFQIRDPHAPDYLRAKIQGSVTVYDLSADPDEPKRYELEEVEAIYPENQPLALNETNAIVVRKQAYEKFAELVARKFHMHKRDL